MAKEQRPIRLVAEELGKRFGNAAGGIIASEGRDFYEIGLQSDRRLGPKLKRRGLKTIAEGAILQNPTVEIKRRLPPPGESS